MQKVSVSLIPSRMFTFSRNKLKTTKKEYYSMRAKRVGTGYKGHHKKLFRQ
ncbi:MAG: hypothetical protein GY699_17725 [Desulfobacteraceae bacterium]|nr:hypothetical protein [Desulfobacteraceae bacterium]